MRRWRTGAAQLARRIAATALATCAAIARAQGPPPLRQYHHTVWPLGDAPLGDAPLGEAPLGPLARIARSPDGYLWAGSPTALVRFDGVRFTRLDGTNVAALRMTDTVTRGFAPLRVDRRGRMWVARPDGALLTYVEGVFRVVLDPGRGHVRYLDLYEDGAGGLWVAADSARHRWIRRLRGDRPVPGTWPAGVPDSGVTRGVPDTADGMWIGTRTQGLWHVTPRGARRYDPPAAVVNAGPGRSLVPELQSADGTVWVFPSSGAGLQRVRGDRWTTVLLDSDPHTMGVSSVAQAPDRSVYIAGRGYGVLRWRDGHLERRPPGDGPAGTAVFDVAVDADGTIWASTDLGLERFRPAPFMTLGRRDGVPFDVPFELSGDASGALWVSSEANALYRLRVGTAREVPDSVIATRAMLPNGMAYRVLVGTHDGVWIAPQTSGLVRVGRAGFTVVGPAAGLPAIAFWAAVEDARGVQWLSEWRGGLARFGEGRFTHLRLPGAFDRSDAQFTTGDSGRSVVATSWAAPFAYAVAPTGALTRLDALAPLRHPLEATAIEGRDTVWGVAVSRSRTTGAALATLVRLTGGRATDVPLPGPVPGLTGFNVRLVVAHGALWFASGGGVGRLPLAALHTAADLGRSAPAPQTFGPVDGLTSPRLTMFALARMFRAPDGRIWLGTPAGLAVVDPSAVPVNPTPPPVHVEEVTVSGRPLPPGELEHMAPNPEHVALHYTAASLRMPERVRVQYRLDGVDRGWVEGGIPRVATYTQLRPGRYRFRVRAWNEDGVPSRGEAVLALRVLPAWYQTAWATGLEFAAVAAVGAAAAGGVARVRRRRAEAVQQATVAERLRVARELHDTILTDLAGLTMHLDAATASRAVVAGTVADGLLPALRDQARRTLRDTRLAVTAMRASADEVVPLWAQLSAAAHRVFAATPVQVSVRHTGTPRRLAPEVDAEVVRIATEALVNAQVHSRCRAVVVSCNLGRSALVVTVRDDGRGFDPGRDGAEAVIEGHWGLAGMQERARALGGALTLDSTPGRGTTVRLRVPIPPASRAM